MTNLQKAYLSPRERGSLPATKIIRFPCEFYLQFVLINRNKRISKFMSDLFCLLTGGQK